MDAEPDDVGDDRGDGNAESGEIDFAEDTGIADECAGGAGDALGEVIPTGDPRHVKEHGRQAVGGELGDAAEDEGEQGGGEDGLDEVPERAEDGLFVLGDEIAPDKHHRQIPIPPEVGEVEVEPAGFGLEDKGPVLVGDRGWEVGIGSLGGHRKGELDFLTAPLH